MASRNVDQNRERLLKYSEGKEYAGQGTKSVFEDISSRNQWFEPETVSGPGSTLEQTAEIVRLLPSILDQLQVQRMLDLPCGDFNWMSKVNLTGVSYTGADIVGHIVARNQERFASENHQFRVLDLMRDPLEDYDLLFCRDCLVHLSIADIHTALRNIKQSQVKYLMTTTFTDQVINKDIPTGGWRLINLQQPPFSLPSPVLDMNEKCTEFGDTFADKCLAVWKVADI